jgi:hypothetical protein
LAPLTRRNRDGDLYLREPRVERQIAGAVTVPGAELRRRMAIADRDSSAYLVEETLVYLLRHYRLAGDEQTVSDIAEALVRRITPITRKYLSSLGPDALEEGYSEVVTRMSGEILDLSTDRADFYQVRFWVRIKRICIQVFNELLANHKRGLNEISFSDIPGDYDEKEAGPAGITEGDKRSVYVPSGEAAVVESDLLREARRVLTQLDEPFRSAYLLRHYRGWPIEHQDPSVETISRFFGKTPRTIRSWLKKADEMLAPWRGGER